MTETARVLLTAGILTAVALTAFVWRLIRPGRAAHEYLIDQLRLSQWAALLLAVSGAIGIGLAAGAAHTPGASVEVTAGLITIAASAFVLRREPPSALVIVALLFLLHGAFDWSHRREFFAITFVPPWWSIGSATYDVYVATLCFVARFLGKATWPK